MTRSLLARVTAGSAFFLLIAGGLVTSTGSGLSVPDWPTSFGSLNPPMVGGVFFEHGHRLIAGTVALMTLALWLGEKRHRTLANLAAGGILLQALLGGLTVLFRLPPQISIAHACLGQLVFCLLCAWADSTAANRIPDGGRDGSLPLAGPPYSWLAAAAFVQLFLGAVLRHTGAGLPLHLLGALLLLALSVRFGAWMGALVLAQAALGLGALLARKATFWSLPVAVALPTAHLAVGALILASAFVLASRRWTTSR